MEFVDRALLLHKSLSNQRKYHLQVTAQVAKLERIQWRKVFRS